MRPHARRRVRLLLAALTALSAPAAAQRAPLVSEIAVRPDGAGGIASETVTTRHFYRVTDFDPEASEILLEVESVVEAFAEDGARDEATTVRAFGWTGSDFSRPLWEFRAPGAQVVLVHHTYLRVTRSGCCTTDDTHTLVPVRTGKPIVSYTEEPLFVGTPDRAGELVVALEAPSGLDIPESLLADGTLRGILRLAGPDGPLDALVVRAAGDAMWLRPAVLRCDPAGGVLVGEWDTGAEGFSACLQLRPAGWIVIPVREGRFLIDRATLPEGVSLERWTTAAGEG